LCRALQKPLPNLKHPTSMAGKTAVIVSIVCFLSGCEIVPEDEKTEEPVHDVFLNGSIIPPEGGDLPMDFGAAERQLLDWNRQNRGLQLLFLCKGSIAPLAIHVKAFSGTVLWESKALLTLVGAAVDSVDSFLIASFPSQGEVLALLKDDKFRNELNTELSQLLLIALPSPSLASRVGPPGTRLYGKLYSLLQRFGIGTSHEDLIRRADGKTFEDGLFEDLAQELGATPEAAEAARKDEVSNKQPIYLLNLLRYKSKANRDIYNTKYGPPTALLVSKLGGSAAFVANAGVQVLIDTLGVGAIDEISLVKYPSWRTYTEMITSDAYAKLNEFRLAAMDGGHLMLTAIQPLSRI